MTPLEPPPPYTPNDPNTPTSPLPHTPTTLSQSTVPTLAVTPTDGDPRASPARESGPILTPPASPNLTSHQTNTIGYEEPVFSASLAYFESRPTIMQLPPDVMSHDIIITEDTTPDDLPYPQPDHVWLARDVSTQDWLTFKNYLFPLAQMEANTQIVERKMQAELDRREQEHVRVGEAPEQDDGLYPPQLGTTPSRLSTDEKSAVDARPLEPEEERYERIRTTVAEWNEGFFHPRGLRITTTLVPYSRPPLSPAPSSITMFVNETEEEQRGNQPDPSDPTITPLHNHAESSSSGPCLNSPTRRHSADSVTLHSPSIEEDPVGALRKSLAKFLLSSRSDPEGALSELSSELRSQRTITLREVKKELHAAKRDMYRDWKAMIEEHRQDGKVYKNLKKAELEQRKIECDRVKADRKGKSKQEKFVRKLGEGQEKFAKKVEEKLEKKQRKVEKRREKDERKTLKKELKAEYRRQMRELHGCRKSPRNSFSPTATAEPHAAAATEAAAAAAS